MAEDALSDDPFSTILSLVEARAACAGGFTAGGAWAIAFPPPQTIKFFVIARGACWIAVEGQETPFHLHEGDVFLLTARSAFVVASDLALPTRDARDVFGEGAPPMQALGPSEDLMFIGGHVDLASASGRLLLESLPPVIHLRGDCAEAERLDWLIRALAREYAEDEAGGSFACTALAQLIFLQVLRGYLARGHEVTSGWLRAISDARLAPALRLMHGDPARNWHLPELARASAMSRTAFATRFKAVAGMAPLTYLALWRMRLAERWLDEGRMSIAQIARAAGFNSDAAFSNAFKRATGLAPRHYRLRALHEPAE